MANEVPIAAIKKRGFLRQIAEGAKRSAATLKEALLAAQTGKFTANFQQGRLLVSTSGSGQSGSFEIGVQGKEWTQDNIFALTEQLLEILEFTVAQEIAIDGPDPGTIDALFAAMCANESLQGITEQLGDFSGLNWPASAPA